MISIKNIDYMKKVLLQDLKEYKKMIKVNPNGDFSIEDNKKAIIRINEIIKNWDISFNMLLNILIDNPDLWLINDEDKNNLTCMKHERRQYSRKEFRFINNDKKTIFICSYNIGLMTFINDKGMQSLKDNFFHFRFHLKDSYGMNYKKKKNIKNYYFDNKLIKYLDKNSILSINKKIKTLTDVLDDFGMRTNYSLTSSISKDNLIKNIISIEYDYTYSKVNLNKYEGLRYVYSIVKKAFKDKYKVNSFKEFKEHYKRKIEINNYISELLNSEKSNNSSMYSKYDGNIIKVYVNKISRPSFYVSIPFDQDIEKIEKNRVMTDKGAIDYTFNDWMNNPEEVFNYIELIQY